MKLIIKQLARTSRMLVLRMLFLMSIIHAQILPEYLNITTDITKSASLDYLLYVPDNYHPSQGIPLLIFLTGEDYIDDISVLRNVGPPGEVESGMSFDYFIAAPQLPGDVLWDTEALLALIDHIGNSYHIDDSQIWLTGYGDRAGWAAWELALLHTDRFKKFAPVASSPGTNVWQAHELSTWIFHGALDERVPIEDAEIMYYELNWDDVDVQLTIFDSLGHDIGDEVYTNPDFYTWLTGESPEYGSGSPNPRNLSMDVQLTKSIDDDYLLYIPEDYEGGVRDWPLVIYLHGSGSAIWDLEAIREGGPPELFEEGMDSDFILLCPQLHDDVHWDIDRIHALTVEIMDNYRVDSSRVYLTGLSRGGFGAWEFGVTYPELFAAIVPISARDVAGVERLVNTDVWIFHGDQDTGVPWQGSQTAYDRLRAAGADANFTLYEGVGHWAWEPAYATQGLWSWMLNQENEFVSIAEANYILPGVLALNQNYPNPFNPSTTISYHVPTTGHATIKIFDVLGREILSILDGTLEAGNYSVQWVGKDSNGNSVETGVYLCQLKSGGYVETIKMVYLR
ncbi:MAG: T9SS type A sorting domain-containing protein [Candidatus Marinimicrobia bacterium]|nr:T9SS type A sorting domain-containing protein [Candidatus Neomarinimicrobiota bacterium]